MLLIGGSGGYLNYDRTSCTNGVDRMLIADAPDMHVADVSGLSSRAITKHIS